jgi:hypothetical protein
LRQGQGEMGRQDEQVHCEKVVVRRLKPRQIVPWRGFFLHH